MPRTVSQMPMSSYVGLRYPGSLLYERDRQANLDDYLALAEEIVGKIQGAGSRLGGAGGWAEPLAQDAITTALQSPGMSAGEYAKAKGRVTGSFRAATGALAKGGGKGGYFSPSGVAQAAGNAPAASLSEGLAELEARNAEIARQERQGGLSALTSLTPGMMAEARRPGEALGELIGGYMESTPLNMTGVGTGYITESRRRRTF